MSRLNLGLSGCPSVVAFLASVAVTTSAGAAVTHNYLFNSGDGLTVIDSVGGMNGAAIDGATVAIADSRLILDGTAGYVALPGPDIAINTYGEVSLELWLVPGAGNVGFTAAAHLGRTSDGSNEEQANLGYDYLMIQPSRGPGDQGSRGAISNGTYDAEVGVTDGARDLNDGNLHHLVLTVDSTDVGYYVDGAQIGTAPLNGFSLANVSNDLAYLGRSLYPDPFFQGSIYEFRIYDNALTDVEVQANYSAGCTDFCGDPLRLEVNRDTGAATFVNDLSAETVVIYTITSASGSIDPLGWASIADNGDADSGGSIDADDIWMVQGTPSSLEISETDPIGGGGPDDGFQVGSPASIGNLWAKSPYEDLVVTATTLDANFNEISINVPVRYTGNGGTSFSRSDFNLDGVLDPSDYDTLLTNHLVTLSGTTAFETFSQGDIDGDGDNDFGDFRLFKADYIAANGLPAFLALTAAVPEPSSAALICLTAAAAAVTRRRR
ncbi:hypothetical protein Pla108_40440 [Botrimarina colliarenosi]|uniref:LamG-like jellyroll fold domain-containing protein n=1 Tax=Botrimarina colliarenosi TaxID=2528001 RepID=A0A5C5ZZB1_9BACT|nr:LamG domain-containing protein [Botrimarina colliarenosi]TWT92904.1 hypothetical protein Pla108_40440 [Botrimarina colliarenosi]